LFAFAVATILLFTLAASAWNSLDRENGSPIAGMFDECGFVRTCYFSIWIIFDSGSLYYLRIANGWFATGGHSLADSRVNSVLDAAHSTGAVWLDAKKFRERSYLLTEGRMKVLPSEEIGTVRGLVQGAGFQSLNSSYWSGIIDCGRSTGFGGENRTYKVVEVDACAEEPEPFRQLREWLTNRA
jgi:hypothetical protein